MSPLTPDSFIDGILEKIQFRLLSEEVPGALFDSYTPEESFHAFDLANTQIFDRSSPLWSLEVLRTPRLSTIAIGYIINRLVGAMRADLAYVNVGFWCGFSFLAAIAGNREKRCVGVDNFSDRVDTKKIFFTQYERFQNDRTEVFAIDYREYFQKHHSGGIGVYFYDGDHSYDNQLRGLEIAAPHLVEGSYVMIDDTNDEAPRAATLEFLRRNPEFRLVCDKKTANNGHPTYWNGVMILKRLGSTSDNHFKGTQF